jgi:AraC family transcriptional regulator of adaptative response/methylated-DNA-[protein]-cysteine methyltransferase
MATNDADRVAAAIRFLEQRFRTQPSLADVARAVGLSPHHFQRLFRRWAGVSPKRFMQYLTLEHSRHALREGRSMLSTALDAGLSGPGRLHDLFVTFEAMTPGMINASGLIPSAMPICRLIGVISSMVVKLSSRAEATR